MAVNFTPLEYSIRGILPRRGFGTFIGPSQGGKSFAIIDVLGHLAQGKDWLGRKVKRTFCALYICGEGREGIEQRVKAWVQENGPTQGRLAVMNDPPNLYREKDAKARIVATVKRLRETTGCECAAICLDTLASLAGGIDENSAKEVSELNVLARQIAKEADCAVVVVHHTGLASQNRARGSTAFYGNVDFEWLLRTEVDKSGGVRERYFTTTKQRDGEQNRSGVAFALKPVLVGKHDDGEAIYSRVFMPKVSDGSALGQVADLPEDEEAPILPAKAGKVRAEISSRDARVLELADAFGRPFTRDELQEAYNRSHGREHGPLEKTTAWRVLDKFKGFRTRLVPDPDDNKRSLWEIMPDIAD